MSAAVIDQGCLDCLRAKKKAEVEMPIAEPVSPEPTPNWLNNWKPWLAGTVGLIVVAYGPVLIQLIGGIASNAAGFQLGNEGTEFGLAPGNLIKTYGLHDVFRDFG